MIRRTRWAWALRLAAAALWCCAALPVMAQTGGTYHVFSTLPNGNDFDISRSNAPALADKLGPCTGCPRSVQGGASAEADGAALTWRTSGGNSASVDFPVGGEVRAESSWAVTVLPGSSGLATGAPVNLTVQIHWDGTVGASFDARGDATGYDMRSGVAGFVGLEIGRAHV